MENQKPVYLTKEGIEKLKEEVHFLRTKERARIARAIAEARSHGDLSENAEYDAAKEEQSMLESRIAKLEITISNARSVDENHIDASKAYIFSTVRVKDLKRGTEDTFTLVSPEEADIMENKISVTSPIGKGLLGRSVGDVAKIDVPAGKVELEVLEINR